MRGCPTTRRGAAFLGRLIQKTAWEGRPTVGGRASMEFSDGL
jgi:hypothetical protein